MMNYLGVSASIGGNDNAAAVGTLPNIFKEYNPEIYGFSTGNGVPLTRPRNKQLNEAVVGAMADDMPTQAQRLVDRMKEDPNVDFENDWKFVTLFIGGNDLCSGCNRENSEPEAYIGFIEEAIQILYDNIPRTFVNVVGILNAYILKDLGGSLKCNLVHNIVCDCLDGSEEAEERMRQRTREYQIIVQEVIDSGKFDGKEDFTAVYQPFFHETVLPLDEDGEPDTSYFAPDCFHFSQKGQAAQALANWNSLFEPVGSKRLEWSPGEELNCPSEEFPYLYTNLNSARNSLSAEHGSENGGHLPVDSLSSGSPERVSKDAVIVMSVFGAIMVAVVCMAAAIYVRKRRVSTHSYQTL